MTVAAPTRSKALAAYREGRVQVRDVYWPTGTPRATFVSAIVNGFKGRHNVEFVDERWSCTCGREFPCAHITAVGLATGHPDPAAGTTSAPPPADVGNDQVNVPDDGPPPPLTPTQAVEQASNPGWATAIRDGACIQCGAPYAKGDPIRMTSTPQGTRWAGRCCAADR